MSENVEIVRRGIDAINRRDVEDYLGAFSNTVSAAWSPSRTA